MPCGRVLDTREAVICIRPRRDGISQKGCFENFCINFLLTSIVAITGRVTQLYMRIAHQYISVLLFL